MFRQLSYYVFSVFIVFIFTLTSISATTCRDDQTWCYSTGYIDYWCCSGIDVCGNTYGSCLSYTTTPSPADVSPGVTVVIVFVSLFFCIMCITCCVRSQQQQQQRIRSSRNIRHGRVAPHSTYQQEPGRRPPRVIHNIGVPPSLHIMHEEPPPSYEDATRNLPPVGPSAPPPSFTTTVDQANLRV